MDNAQEKESFFGGPANQPMLAADTPSKHSHLLGPDIDGVSQTSNVMDRADQVPTMDGDVQTLKPQYPIPDPAHAVSGLERLPTELLDIIDGYANNPWLAFACPSLYNTFNTASYRQRYVELFISHLEGLPDGRQNFNVLVRQPWFLKAIFGGKDGTPPLSTPYPIERLIQPGNASVVLLHGDLWTQVMGDFSVELLRRYKARIVRSLSRPKCEVDQIPIMLCLSLDRRCEPAIRLFGGLDMRAHLDASGTGVSVINCEIEKSPQFERWIRPWTSLPADYSSIGIAWDCQRDHNVATFAASGLDFRHRPVVFRQFANAYVETFLAAAQADPKLRPFCYTPRSVGYTESEFESVCRARGRWRNISSKVKYALGYFLPPEFANRRRYRQMMAGLNARDRHDDLPSTP